MTYTKIYIVFARLKTTCNTFGIFEITLSFYTNLSMSMSKTPPNLVAVIIKTITYNIK